MFFQNPFKLMGQVEGLFREKVKKTAGEKGVYFYGFENPSVLILVSNDRRNPYGIQDSACAAENIMLAAHSYGIGSVWLNPLMTLCDEPSVRKMLDDYHIPKHHNVWATIALGYPAENGRLLTRKKNTMYQV